MTVTRDDVIDAIHRIERAGHAGEATKAAQAELLLPLPAQEYEQILSRLRAGFPQLFAQVPPPGAVSEQRGSAAQAMKNAEAALAQQQSASSEFDRQVIEALLHANKTTTEGRQLLEDLETQINDAARSWDLSTAVGAREFQRFLITKLGKVADLVENTNADDTSKQALAAALAMLYAAQTSAGGSAPAETDGAISGVGSSPPQTLANVDPDFYPGPLSPDEPEPAGAGLPPRAVSAVPTMPAVPGLGGEVPPAAGMPAGAALGGPPLTGLTHGLPHALTAGQAGAEPGGVDDASFDEPDDDADSDTTAAPEPPASAGPTTVTLPTGDTIVAATPQLAAVIQAAVDGTPVAEAFHRQGITIPAPGTAVAAPIDLSRVGTGDIGMFTDRHALAVDSSKAVLDGQIQQIANVRGPSFLGWQHPPVPSQAPIQAPSPTPTRLSATVPRR